MATSLAWAEPLSTSLPLFQEVTRTVYGAPFRHASASQTCVLPTDRWRRPQPYTRSQVRAAESRIHTSSCVSSSIPSLVSSVVLRCITTYTSQDPPTAAVTECTSSACVICAWLTADGGCCAGKTISVDRCVRSLQFHHAGVRDWRRVVPQRCGRSHCGRPRCVLRHALAALCRHILLVPISCDSCIFC